MRHFTVQQGYVRDYRPQCQTKSETNNNNDEPAFPPYDIFGMRTRQFISHVLRRKCINLGSIGGHLNGLLQPTSAATVTKSSVPQTRMALFIFFAYELCATFAHPARRYCSMSAPLPDPVIKDRQPHNLSVCEILRGRYHRARSGFPLDDRRSLFSSPDRV